MPEIMGGVRILDFTQEIQGPWGTAILADMGAEVIKVERRETGELSRGAVSPDNPELQGLSPYFTVHNRGKKSITLDLKRPEAVRIVHQIAATSDVVVNNWRPNVLDRLGFGYRQLRETKPDIIFVTASAFGARGPWSARPGRDILGPIDRRHRQRDGHRGRAASSRRRSGRPHGRNRRGAGRPRRAALPRSDRRGPGGRHLPLRHGDRNAGLGDHPPRPDGTEAHPRRSRSHADRRRHLGSLPHGRRPFEPRRRAARPLGRNSVVCSTPPRSARISASPRFRG